MKVQRKNFAKFSIRLVVAAVLLAIPAVLAAQEIIIESCAQRGCNNFIEIGRVFPGIRHFVHGNLFPNTQYYYRVRAFNAGGTSAHTDVVSAKTLRK